MVCVVGVEWACGCPMSWWDPAVCGLIAAGAALMLTSFNNDPSAAGVNRGGRASGPASTSTSVEAPRGLSPAQEMATPVLERH